MLLREQIHTTLLNALGPQERELRNLHLSLRLLTRHFNGAFRYPVLVCHDSEVPSKERRRLQEVGGGLLRFSRVHNELPEQSSAVQCDECMASVAFRPADAATRSRASARASAPAAAAPAVAPSAAPATATHECRFFFVDAARLLDFEGAIMPHYQQLLRAHPGTRTPVAHA